MRGLLVLLAAGLLSACADNGMTVGIRGTIPMDAELIVQ